MEKVFCVVVTHSTGPLLGKGPLLAGWMDASVSLSIHPTEDLCGGTNLHYEFAANRSTETACSNLVSMAQKVLQMFQAPC